MSDLTSIKTPSETGDLFARAYCYRLLSVLLRHPLVPGTAEAYSEMADAWESVPGAFPGKDRSDFRQLLANLFRSIEVTDENEWARQYEQIFGHTANSNVPPYELEYGEEHSHRQPQQLADIAAFYRAFGLEMGSGSGERVDHVSAECEFMSYLCLKEGVAREKDGEEKARICQEASLRFFKDHLVLWVPAFLSRLEKSSQNGILKETANFARLFITLECEHLQVHEDSESVSIRAVEKNIETGCVSCVLNPMGTSS